MSNDKIADRVRKLIRLSEGSTEGEAQTALAQAQRLAAKYHLDMAALSVADADPMDMSRSEVELWSGRKRRYRWQLAHVVAGAHGCAPWSGKRAEVVLERCPDDETIRKGFFATMDDSFRYETTPTAEGHTKITATWLWKVGADTEDFAKPWNPLQSYGIKSAWSKVVLVMIGRRDAAQAAIYVFNMLLRSVDEIAKRVAHGRAGLNSARWGIINGLEERLETDEEERDEPEVESESTALVLAEACKSSERFLADAYGSEPYARADRHVISDRSAYFRGRDAAEEIELPDPNGARTRLGGGRALPPGRDRQLPEKP